MWSVYFLCKSRLWHVGLVYARLQRSQSFTEIHFSTLITSTKTSRKCYSFLTLWKGRASVQIITRHRWEEKIKTDTSQCGEVTQGSLASVRCLLHLILRDERTQRERECCGHKHAEEAVQLESREDFTITDGSRSIRSRSYKLRSADGLICLLSESSESELRRYTNFDITPNKRQRPGSTDEHDVLCCY